LEAKARVFLYKKYNIYTRFTLNFLIIHGTQKDNETLAFLLSFELALIPHPPPQTLSNIGTASTCQCKEKEDKKRETGVAIMTVLAVVRIPIAAKTLFLIFFP
jgi:hypothetical protein